METSKPSSDIIALLDSEATRINRPEFIINDPVQFPRRFSDPRDIEITAFLSAIIAWGKRSMICRDAEKMLSLMDQQPYRYTIEEGYLDLDPDMNIHRTFFALNMTHFLKGMRRIMLDYGSLDAFAAAKNVASDPTPAWRLVEEMQRVMQSENNGLADSRALPVNIDKSALKRVNMALRWLVRDDGIVDMGIWKSIPKNKLFIPLDVHVGNTARNLNLLSRKANDKKSVELLTDTLRQIRPDDPVFYDYALFGIGVGE